MNLKRRHSFLDIWILQQKQFIHYGVQLRQLKVLLFFKPLRNAAGALTRNDSEKGDLFVNHLRNVFTPNLFGNMVNLHSSTAVSHHAISFGLAELNVKVTANI